LFSTFFIGSCAFVSTVCIIFFVYWHYDRFKIIILSTFPIFFFHFIIKPVHKIRWTTYYEEQKTKLWKSIKMESYDTKLWEKMSSVLFITAGKLKKKIIPYWKEFFFIDIKETRKYLSKAIVVRIWVNAIRFYDCITVYIYKLNSNVKFA
jgi:hypothetical protein